MADISPWFYIGSIIVGVLTWLASKNWKIGVLVGYMLIIFSIAALSRGDSSMHHNNFILFQTYRQGINQQIMANILFFIPIGMILGSINRNLAWIGFLFSVLIEFSQLLFRRGMFDADDIVSNTIGTIIGLGLFLLFDKGIERLHT